jgi:hypothetical protein
VQDLNRQLVGILRGRKDVYVRLLEAISIESFGDEWVTANPGASGQIVDGMLGVFVEGLEGQGTEVRSFVLATLVPSVLEDRDTPESLVTKSIRFIMLIVCDAIEQVPAENREAAVQWLVRFSSDYLAEVAKLAFEAKASRP